MWNRIYAKLISMARVKSEKIDVEHFDLWQAIIKMDGKLDKILDQTTRTNSRVTHLEGESTIARENYLREALAGKVNMLEIKMDGIEKSTEWSRFVGSHPKIVWFFIILILTLSPGLHLMQLLKLF